MSNFNFSDAFSGTERSKKEADTIRELQRLANDLLRLFSMPNGDPISTYHSDIHKNLEQMRQLVGLPDLEKMIDWAALVADVKQDLDVDKYWDSENQTYRKTPSGGIDWMGALKTEQPAKPEKKQDKPGNIGSLFSL